VKLILFSEVTFCVLTASFVEAAQESTRFTVHSWVKMICAASFSFQADRFRDCRRIIGKLRLTPRIIRLRLEMLQQGRFPTPPGL
jgi:hypothetical protein